MMLTFTFTWTHCLQGKRSCHTGYRKTAGWMMPVGILTADGTVRAFAAVSGSPVSSCEKAPSPGQLTTLKGVTGRLAAC
jgi:hypothetical protein